MSFIEAHKPFAMLMVIIVLVGLILLLERWRDYHLSRSYRNLRIWKYIRYQGGGSIEGPYPMTEAEAMEFCRSMGVVAYVDREHGFIFYRPKTG